MPHARKRHVTPLILKKLKFTPIVALQGARQTGKSFLGREILAAELGESEYLTLDDKNLRMAAQDAPDDFLKRYSHLKPLILDEVQKSPDLFDALKLNVDENRVPGKFLILGSTEFSKLAKIRESLTGRMSRVRVYPFNLAESLSRPPNPSLAPHLLNLQPRVTREELHLYLQRGGLPGLFSVRSELERDQAFSDLLDLILFRDARYVKWFDPELGRDILEQIARLETPNLAQISESLKLDSRRIKRHVQILQELFVISSLEPHAAGFGKSLYFIYDCGIARFLGASQLRVIQTWFLNEQLSQRSYRGELKWKLHYYSTQKGSLVDLLIEVDQKLVALQFIETAHVKKTDLLVLKGLQKKLGLSAPPMLVAIGPFSKSYEEGGVAFFPYEAVA